MKFLRPAPIILCLLVLSFYTAPVQGADATSFDPTLVSIEAKSSGGVPVGTIVAWPVATNPSDWDKWLECNGQSISQAVYPELFAVIGANVPDLSGLFLRGYGGNSDALGSPQEDAVRAGFGVGTLDKVLVWGDRYRSHTGIFKVLSSSPTNVMSDGSIDDATGLAQDLEVDLSGGAPTSVEFRPVNMAVRYLIRSLP